jgi:hypothetical protein
MAAYDHDVNISQDESVSKQTFYRSHTATSPLPTPLSSLTSYSSDYFNYYVAGDERDGQLFGNYTDQGESSSHSANFLLGQQIEVTDDVLLTDVGLIVDGNAGGSAMANIGIYADDGGQPGTLVAETGLFDLGLGYQQIPVLSQTVLPAGDYWYMAVYDNTVSISQGDTFSELTYYRSHDPNNPLPSDLTSLTSYTGKHFNYYLVTDLYTAIPGDGNGDGWVDGLDYLIWAGNFGTHPGVDGDTSDGDYNDDGWIDGLDYLIWAGNFGSHATATVPEPAAGGLFVMGLMLLYSRRCRSIFG